MQHAPLVIDVAGLSLNDDDRRRICHPLVGGLILFGRNWRDRAQLTALCAEAKALRPDLLVCVDHEGGRVQRFRSDGFTHLPPMRVLGGMWMAAAREKVEGEAAMQAMSVATACGYLLGAELRACGVDFSFTPVLAANTFPAMASCVPTPTLPCRWTAAASRPSWPMTHGPTVGWTRC